MRLFIDIPEEYEGDFKTNRFSDCFNRAIGEINYNMEHNEVSLLGNYERETFVMLCEAFRDAEVIPEDCDRILMLKDIVVPAQKKE